MARVIDQTTGAPTNRVGSLLPASVSRPAPPKANTSGTFQNATLGVRLSLASNWFGEWGIVPTWGEAPRVYGETTIIVGKSPGFVMVAGGSRRDSDNLESEFEFRFRRWKDETMFISSNSEMVMHRDYQRIIGMGPAAVPFLIRALQKESCHVFWALMCISGENPVPEEYRGQVMKMRDTWLAWGRRRGYV